MARRPFQAGGGRAEYRARALDALAVVVGGHWAMGVVRRSVVDRRCLPLRARATLDRSQWDNHGLRDVRSAIGNLGGADGSMV